MLSPEPLLWWIRLLLQLQLLPQQTRARLPQQLQQLVGPLQLLHLLPQVELPFMSILLDQAFSVSMPY